ncbi:MAG: aldose 1-epimerase [Bacillota bacterium]|nr:aldose 1-epimerase [Bacillota bacterium]MDW7677711.1 aldose 1-epimerase [Bacillota bacterium]
MQAQYRHHGCRITDDLRYKGYRSLFIENDLLRIGILLDKGTDIFQFLHKPSDTDFLWRSPQGLISREHFMSTKSSSSGSFLDSYHGGWQEILPGGGPDDYQGAELGLHGEITHLGWQYEILEDQESCVAVKMTVDCVRTPLRIEKTLRLEKGKPVLFIKETVTNLSPSPIDFMWGHHPAFGAPFLREGVRLFVPAQEAETHEPAFSPNGILEPGSRFNWPKTEAGGKEVDFSLIPDQEAGYSELLYLKNVDSGWYALLDPEKQIGIGLVWPIEVFPYLWFWLVYGRASGYPWWDRTYCIAVEPWSSIPNHLSKAIETGTTLHLEGGGDLQVEMSAAVITGVSTVSHLSLDGSWR